MEIVQIRFRVQIIPSVPERIESTDAIDIGQNGAVAPRRSRIASIAVACNFGAARVVDCDDVAEHVLLVQIIIKLFICVGRVAVHHAHREPIIVVEVHEQLIAPFLRDNPVAVKRIGVRNAVHRLGQAHALVVIGERKRFAVRRRGCKLSAVLPREGVRRSAVVGQGVSDRVIGDRVSLVGRQEVAPRGVGVPVASCEAAGNFL